MPLPCTIARCHTVHSTVPSTHPARPIHAPWRASSWTPAAAGVSIHHDLPFAAVTCRYLPLPAVTCRDPAARGLDDLRDPEVSHRAPTFHFHPRHRRDAARDRLCARAGERLRVALDWRERHRVPSRHPHVAGEAKRRGRSTRRGNAVPLYLGPTVPRSHCTAIPLYRDPTVPRSHCTAAPLYFTPVPRLPRRVSISSATGRPVSSSSWSACRRRSRGRPSSTVSITRRASSCRLSSTPVFRHARRGWARGLRAGGWATGGRMGYGWDDS